MQAATSHTNPQIPDFGGDFQEVSSLLHLRLLQGTDVPPATEGSSCLQRQLPTG